MEGLEIVHKTVGENTRDMIWYNSELSISGEFEKAYSFINGGVSGYISPMLLMPIINNSIEQLWKV